MVSPVGESGIEVVAPVKTAARADVMQTPPLIRQSLRISSRQTARVTNGPGSNPGNVPVKATAPGSKPGWGEQ